MKTNIVLYRATLSPFKIISDTATYKDGWYKTRQGPVSQYKSRFNDDQRKSMGVGLTPTEAVWFAIGHLDERIKYYKETLKNITDKRLRFLRWSEKELKEENK